MTKLSWWRVDSAERAEDFVVRELKKDLVELLEIDDIGLSAELKAELVRKVRDLKPELLEWLREVPKE